MEYVDDVALLLAESAVTSHDDAASELPTQHLHRTRARRCYWQPHNDDATEWTADCHVTLETGSGQDGWS